MTDFSPYVSFLTSSLNSAIHSKVELENICRYHSSELKLFPNEDPYAFLCAIGDVESDFGSNNVPRWELGYSRSSLAFKRSKLLREGYQRWGDLCAMSYGSHQILWIVARELGYPENSSPLDLWSSMVSLPYVIEKLNSFHEYGAQNVSQLAAMYNAGPGVLKDTKRWPVGYVNKLIFHYNKRKGN